MSFMVPRIEKTSYWLIETSEGGHIVTGDVFSYDRGSYWDEENDCLVSGFVASVQNYVPGVVLDAEPCDGYLWRLSAPGYLDATEWSAADSLQEAIGDCLGMYGDSFDESDLRELGSYLDGFDDFVDEYVLAIGFTAHAITEDSDEYDSAFPCRGDFGDCYAAEDVWEHIDDESRVSVLQDCLSFWNDASELCGAKKAGDAGSDFHLTRNGHGAGFWDGDWPDDLGRKLTALAKPYGTCELTKWVAADGSESWTLGG